MTHCRRERRGPVGGDPTSLPLSLARARSRVDWKLTNVRVFCCRERLDIYHTMRRSSVIVRGYWARGRLLIWQVEYMLHRGREG